MPTDAGPAGRIEDNLVKTLFLGEPNTLRRVFIIQIEDSQYGISNPEDIHDSPCPIDSRATVKNQMAGFSGKYRGFIVDSPRPRPVSFPLMYPP